tara:strand:+ start:643 stop:1527 length:885 start_codon:yes stop_codon:yes gene_type:complete
MASERKHFPKIATDHLLIIDIESVVISNKASQFYGKEYAYDFGAMLINLNTGKPDVGSTDVMATLFDHSFEGLSYRLWTAKHRPKGQEVKVEEDGTIIQPEDFWAVSNLKKRKKNYIELYRQGKRSMSVYPMVNKWLEDILKLNSRIKPIVAAYNIPYDARVGEATDLMEMFGGQWKPYPAGAPAWLPESQADNVVDLYVIAQKALLRKVNGTGPYEELADNPYCDKRLAKKYEDWATRNGYLTKTGRPQLTAEKLGWFIGNMASIGPEPHTAKEDIDKFERPIARWLRKNRFI